MQQETTGANKECCKRIAEGSRRILQLERKLKKHCIQNNLNEVHGMTIMFNEEEGRNLKYVLEMPLEQIRSYSGFVQGNVLGWDPISISEIIRWLNPHYTIEKFIESFQNK